MRRKRFSRLWQWIRFWLVLGELRRISRKQGTLMRMPMAGL